MTAHKHDSCLKRRSVIKLVMLRQQSTDSFLLIMPTDLFKEPIKFGFSCKQGVETEPQ